MHSHATTATCPYPADFSRCIIFHFPSLSLAASLTRCFSLARAPPALRKQSQSAFTIAHTASALSRLKESSGGIGPIGDHHTLSNILSQFFMKRYISMQSYTSRQQIAASAVRYVSLVPKKSAPPPRGTSNRLVRSTRRGHWGAETPQQLFRVKVRLCA